MNRMTRMVCLAAILALLGGCGKAGTESSPAAEPDHAAEARRTITPENMDRQLADLEAEITADEASIEE